MRKSAVLVSALLLCISGCGLIGLYSIPYGSDMRTHNGITVYAKPDVEWSMIFKTVDQAYEKFIDCVGSGWSHLPKSTPVVIVTGFPQLEAILAWPFLGKSDLKRIYVYAGSGRIIIAHEWLHVYLFSSGLSVFGDPGHANPIWDQCRLK